MTEAEPKFLDRCPYTSCDITEGYWYHMFDFLEGTSVVPEFDFRGKVDKFLPCNISGKTFLDIGAGNGFFGFEMERRGAIVTSVDLPLDRGNDSIPYRGSPDRADSNRCNKLGFHKAYWYAHSYFGSKARVFYSPVLELPDNFGIYDVVWLGSILQHSKDPVGSVIRADKHTGKQIVLCEARHDSHLPELVFCAEPGKQDPQYWTWWRFSPAFLVVLLKTLGYSDITATLIDLVGIRQNIVVPSVVVTGYKND